ncbi:hypothetical protein BgiBS90_002177, partial [Biomphalaria glabrata]
FPYFRNKFTNYEYEVGMACGVYFPEKKLLGMDVCSGAVLHKCRFYAVCENFTYTREDL